MYLADITGMTGSADLSDDLEVVSIEADFACREHVHLTEAQLDTVHQARATPSLHTYMYMYMYTFRIDVNSVSYMYFKMIDLNDIKPVLIKV